MTKNTTEPKKTRTQYSQSYKDDALALAERIGFAKAAAQLGIQDSNKTHVVCELSNSDAGPVFKHATNIYLKAGKELQLLKHEDK